MSARAFNSAAKGNVCPHTKTGSWTLSLSHYLRIINLHLVLPGAAYHDYVILLKFQKMEWPTCTVITVCVKPTCRLYHFGCLVDSIIFSSAALQRQRSSLSRSFSLSVCQSHLGCPILSFCFLWHCTAGFFTPTKMSSIILNNIPAHYPGSLVQCASSMFCCIRLKISIVSCWETHPYQQSPICSLDKAFLCL